MDASNKKSSGTTNNACSNQPDDSKNNTNNEESMKMQTEQLYSAIKTASPLMAFCLLHKEGKLPKVLNLSDYDVTAVATLVDYMATGGHTKARITTSILGDLMELARVLEMKSLREKIEEFVLLSAVQSLQFLVHALTMISREMLLDTSVGIKVIDIAVNEFSRIRKISSFNDIPLDIILRILDRCDLNMESEYEVAEAAVAWLAARPERVHISYLVLRCIRVVNLSAEQRFDLFSLISTMPHYARTASAFAHYTFNNTNALRVCVLAEHHSYKRCGNKSCNMEFTISIPNRRIVCRRKTPVKASYVTAKPKSGSALPSISEEKREPISDGEDLKHTIFSVSQERRTTRAERMIRYREEDLKREQKRRRRVLMPAPIKEGAGERENSNVKSDSSGKSNKNKRSSSRNQRKTAGSSPSNEDQSSSYLTSRDSDGDSGKSTKSSSPTGSSSSTASGGTPTTAKASE